MNNTRNLLIFLFLLAIFMGAGPGLYLINPDPLDPDADFLAFGLPVIYVWGLFWYVVQFAVILYAYKYLWRGGEDA